MNKPSFKKGDRVVFQLRDRKLMYGEFKHVAPNGKAYVVGEDKKAYERDIEKLKLAENAKTAFKINAPGLKLSKEQGMSEEATKPGKTFHINQRFQFLEQLVRMVIKGSAVSLIVTGEGGLGKSYTVLDQLKKKMLQKGEQYEVIKGYSTARGLYETLYNNNGKIMVYDDCDEILEHPVALNLLKGALDSYDERTIYWISKLPAGVTSDVPQSFEFYGRIIFISNKSQEQIEQALLSRALSVDLTMSLEDKLNRMEAILPGIRPSVPVELKKECLELVKENAELAHDLNLRTFMKVIDIRTDVENAENWKDLAMYAMINTVS